MLWWKPRPPDPEVARLRAENTRLEAELARVTTERDQYYRAMITSDARARESDHLRMEAEHKYTVEHAARLEAELAVKDGGELVARLDDLEDKLTKALRRIDELEALPSNARPET